MMCAIAAALIVATAGSVSAQQPGAIAAARRLASRVTAIIQGRAVNASNAPLVNTSVRVRDARSGRVANRSLTDKLGAFTFKGLDPGSYVVEIVDQGQTTIAATNLISANAGETVTAIVKLRVDPSILEGLVSKVPVTGSTGLRQIPLVVPAGAPVSEQ
jgi:hypothetical protein